MTSRAVPLKLNLFGSMQLEVDGATVTAPLAKKEQWLLALLALRPGKPVERDFLAGLLWPDCQNEQALYNLRRSLNRLRDALGTQADRIQSVKPRSLCLLSADVSIDVLTFDRLMATNDPILLREAVALYRAPLLQDCYEEWALPERHPREFAYHRALEALAAHAMACEDWLEAERCCRLWVAADPLQEQAHRLLMETLARGGNHARAAAVYRDLRLRLREEINADPDPETRVMAERIREEARKIGAEPQQAEARLRAAGPPIPVIPEAASSGGAAPPVMRLPAPVTRLIGRELELSSAGSLLLSARLVTLVGAGGVGKTRLAVELARNLSGRFPDGAAFVSLAAVADETLIARAVSAALDFKEEGDRPLTAVLCDRLRDRGLLLVLDNCEHLLDAVASLCHTLLASCPALRIIATSRQGLGTPGEVALSISPLPLPPMVPDRLPDYPKAEPSAALAYPSVQLFLERAYQACPELRVSPSDLRAVTQICRRLDGLPLALELAASRVRALSLEQIAARLADSLRLLDRGVRTENAHQRTLRGLLDWSFRLLEEPEKQVFARLAVFAGGWTVEAAEAVCAGAEDEAIEAWEMLDLVAGLAEKSLVIVDRRDGEVRYRMLETVRQYALEKLVERGEEPELRRKHRDRFLALATEADPHLSGEQQLRWLDLLETEHDNLRQAFTFCLETPGEAEAALRFAMVLHSFWFGRGHLSEGRERCAAVLSHPETQQPTIERASVLNGTGVFAWHQGDYAAARRLYEESLAIRRALDDQWGVARSLNNLASLAYDLDDYATARALHEEALAIKRVCGTRYSIAYSLNGLAMVVQAQGDNEGAHTLYAESLAIWRECGDKQNIAGALGNLGTIAHYQGDYAAARPLYEESLALWSELGNRMGRAMFLGNLGLIYLEQGDTALEAGPKSPHFSCLVQRN